MDQTFDNDPNIIYGDEEEVVSRRSLYPVEMTFANDPDAVYEDEEEVRLLVGEAVEVLAVLLIDLCFRVAIEAHGPAADALRDRVGSKELPETWVFDTPKGCCAIYHLPGDIDPNLIAETDGELDGISVTLKAASSRVVLPPLPMPVAPWWRSDPRQTRMATAPAWAVAQLAAATPWKLRDFSAAEEDDDGGTPAPAGEEVRA